MSKEKKSNVIQFPNRMLEIEKKLKESREAVQYISDEAADTAQYMLDIIESELQMSPESDFHRMDFRDERTRESRDMYAIINLINAMFLRFAGVPHKLQKELDRVFVKTHALYKQGKQDIEIEFEPEFNIPIDPDEGGLGDDDDNS
tara:strand:+ start:379 stop:816 length:438 start_codon:yes stop_codon:yes gene_type:complete